MNTVQTAILGGGSIGKVHIYAYRTLPFYSNPIPLETHIKYVVNSRPETAYEAARLAGEDTIPLTDWHDAVEDPDVKIVHICLPNHLHFEALKAAITAGKDIYCEKPVVKNEAEAEELLTLLEGYRGVTQAAFHIRYFASAMYAHELIQSGKIGRVLEFRGAYMQNSHVNPNRPLRWKNLKSAGGGALMDIGSHLLELTDWLAGPLERGMAFQKRATSENSENSDRADDSTVMIWRSEAGAIGTLHASKMAHGTENDMTLEIYGTEGAIRFNLQEPHFLDVFDGHRPVSPFGGEAGWTRIPVGNRYPAPDTDFPAAKSGIGWVRAHCTAVAHFLRRVADRNFTEDAPDLKRGIRIQKLIAQAQEE